MKNTLSNEEILACRIVFNFFKWFLNSFSPSKKEVLYPFDECHLFLIRDNEGNISCVTKN